MTLVILAAGMGSRFGGLKQVQSVDDNGNFIIDYSIYDAIECGFNKVVFVIKKENYEIFKETVGKRIEEKIKVEYIFQELEDLPEGVSVPEGRVKPWGTAHALYACRNVVDENFAIISADDFYSREAFKLLKEHFEKENDFCLIGYHVGETMSRYDAVKRGVCFLDDNNNLEAIVESEVKFKEGKIISKPLKSDEEKELDYNHPVSMLMFGLTPYIFDLIGDKINTFFKENLSDLNTCEFYLPDILTDYIKMGNKIKVIPTNGKWYGITYKEDLLSLQEEIKNMKKEGIYPENLWN